MVEIRFEIIPFPHKTEVWLKEKGLAHEDELAPTQDTLENLQKECYAQFGRNNQKTFPPDFWLKPTSKMKLNFHHLIFFT